MRAADYLAYTWRNVTRAQLRLWLTVTAVVIGATLVVVMTSVGGGIQRNVLDDVRRTGGLNEIAVSAQSRVQPGVPTSARAGALADAVVDRIAALDGVAAVLPQLALLGGAELRYEGLSAQPMLVGVPFDRAAGYGLAAGQGSVAPEPGQVVLGARVAEGFYDANRQRVFAPDLYGRQVSLLLRRAAQAPTGGGLPGFGAAQPPPPAQSEQELQVAGILQATGTQDDFIGWLNVDDVLSAYEWLGRRPDLATDGYHALRVRAVSTDRVRAVQDAIGEFDLQATSPLSVIDEVNRGMLVLQALLGTIGLVALIVSGLGVANTMLMATFERTREIGVLKALGATDTQIGALFLVEASCIGLLGAAMGLVMGWVATQIINAVVGQILASGMGAGPGAPPTVLYTPGWVPALVVASAWMVAVLAGLYPAMRAANLNIARALRAD